MAFGLDLGNLLVHLKLDDSQFINGMRNIEDKMSVMATKLTSMGTKMSLGVTLPLTLMARSAVRSFGALEEGFIGVQKTVNGTEEQLAKLKAGFETMSKTIPISTVELFKIGEAAGQLGIKTENILSFSKVMAQLGVTTNLSADEAASSLARFANVTGMSQDNFDRLGATIVELGNNLATTEAEIVGMAMRLSGAGHQIGLTEAEILSLAGALSSVGIMAEQGGSAFSRIMLEMNSAVKSNTENLRKFATVAGMSGGEFANLFNDNVTSAITAFTDGLVRMKEEGRDLTPIFDSMGLTGVRIIDVLGRMSSQAGTLQKSFDLGNKAWRENTALVEEAEKKFKSFNSQIQITKNYMTLAAGNIAEYLIPYLTDLQELIKKGIDHWIKLSDETKQSAINFALISAAIGPALLIAGQMAKAMSGLIKVFIDLRVIIFSMSIPFGLMTASIVAIVGLAYILRAAWNQGIDGVRSSLNAMMLYFKDAFEYIRNTAIGQFIEASFDSFVQFFKSVQNGFRQMVADIGGVLNAVKKEAHRGLWGIPAKKGQWAKDFTEGYDEVLSMTQDFTLKLGKNLEIAKKELTSLTWNTSGDQLGDIPELMTGFVPAIQERLSQVMEATKKQLKEDFQGIIDLIKKEDPELKAILERIGKNVEIDINAAKTIEDLEFIKNAYVKTIDDMEKSNEKIKQSWASIFDETTQKGTEFMQSTSSIMENGLMGMVKSWENWGDQVKQILKEVYYEAIRIAFIKPLASGMASGFSAIGAGLSGGIGGLFGSVAAATGTGITGWEQTPAFATAAEGGSVERTGWALIHKGEEYSGIGQTLNSKSGGNFELRLHYEGQPLVEDKRKTYIESDQRIAEVWLRLAETNMSVQSKVRSLATS